MFDDYVVEVGGVEIILTLLRKGNLEKGTEPFFGFTSGTDWEGDEVAVPKEDVETAVDFVKSNWSDEVYV